MKFIQLLSTLLNLILPLEKIEKEKIKGLLENRIIFHSKTFAVHFFPYQNIFINKAITSLKFRNNKKRCCGDWPPHHPQTAAKY